MPSIVEGVTLSERARLDLTSIVPASALAVASGLHLAALTNHARQGLVVGGFFLITAAFQLIAAWVVAPGGAGARTRTWIAAGNIAIIALWAWSRTAGLPLGDHAGPETISLLDGLAVAAEIFAVVRLCLSRDLARARRTVAASGAALLLIMVLTGAGGGAMVASESHIASRARARAPAGEPGRPSSSDGRSHPHHFAIRGRLQRNGSGVRLLSKRLRGAPQRRQIASRRHRARAPLVDRQALIGLIRQGR